MDDNFPGVTALYQQYAGTLRAILFRILRNPVDVEDTLQEVFVEIWRKNADYDPARGTLIAWMVQLARSRGIDRVRGIRRAAEVMNDIGEQQKIAPVLSALAEPSPDNALESAQMREKLQKMLERLQPEQKAVLELSYFQGLTHHEIATTLQLPLGTVKTRILIAMRILREQMSTLDSSKSGGWS